MIQAFGGIDAVCDALSGGSTIMALAKLIGLSDGALRVWIAADETRSARARGARAIGAGHWDEKATDLIAEAADPFELSKAKELAFHYRWRASKLAPKDFGEKVQHTGADDAPLFPAVTVMFGKD